MTSTLPAQIEAVREHGPYWVNIFGKWRVAHWRRSGKTNRWDVAGIENSVPDDLINEVGPRIPDPVTLQQHERLEAVVTRFATVIVAGDFAFTGEQWEAALVEAERVYHGGIAALDTAAPDKPEDAERGLRRDG